MEEDCSIEEAFRLSGVVSNIRSPIFLQRDYISNNIESIEDIFDLTSPPGKEKFDRCDDVDDDLKLEQWWYKPVIIFWPK